jgi:hypothetical protein
MVPFLGGQTANSGTVRNRRTIPYSGVVSATHPGLDYWFARLREDDDSGKDA